MRSHLIDDPATARRLRAGPVREHIDAFAEQLIGLGYARSTIHAHVQLIRRFDQWLGRHHVGRATLDGRVVGEFLDARRTRHHTRRRGGASLLERFLQYLRALGAISSPTPVFDPSPQGHLERTYRQYLRAERGLCSTTIDNYSRICRQFLTERLGDAGSVRDLTAVDVSAFVRGHARDCAVLPQPR